MQRRRWSAVVLAALTVLGGTGADWLSFRGEQGEGIVRDGENLPDSWNIVTNENIAWKTPLPGRGLSAPVVVGDRVFVTASSGHLQDRLQVLCFSAADGKQLWQRTFWATGRTMCHDKTSVAANTPVSDGKRIFALFSSNDVFALDFDGRLLWARALGTDYPNASNSLGMASSPVTADGTLVLQLENDSESLALGVDTATGGTRWKLDRPAAANWTSPGLRRDKATGKTVVLLQSSAGLAAFDVKSGSPEWDFAEGCSTIPSQTSAGELVLVPSKGLTALRPQANGKPEVVWQDSKLAPGTSSAVVYKNRVYVIARAGVLKCGKLESGELLWQIRLKGAFSGTPVAADDKLYAISEEGVGQVVDLRDGISNDERVIQYNDLNETILCTPAIAGQALYVRSDRHLWKIAKVSPKP